MIAFAGTNFEKDSTYWSYETENSKANEDFI